MRDDILAGTIRPGERLMFPDVCERYGVSVGVAREALAALVVQGLVQTAAHQGHRVTPISAQDLEELSTARMMIEPLVLELSVQHGGVEWEATVIAAHHLLSRTAHIDPAQPQRSTPAWASTHAAFHDALFAGCGNTKLIDIARQLAEEAALYRRWSDSLTANNRDVIVEHAELLDAALSGEPKLASDRLREHIRRTAISLIDFTEE